MGRKKLPERKKFKHIAVDYETHAKLKQQATERNLKLLTWVAMLADWQLAYETKRTTKDLK